MPKSKPDLDERPAGHFYEHHAHVARQVLTHRQSRQADRTVTAAMTAHAARNWAAAELCMTSPASGPSVADAIVAETGADIPVPTARHLAAGAGVAPASDESARLPSASRKPTRCSLAATATDQSSQGRVTQQGHPRGLERRSGSTGQYRCDRRAAAQECLVKRFRDDNYQDSARPRPP
jgi:hypothetical protein